MRNFHIVFTQSLIKKNVIVDKIQLTRPLLTIKKRNSLLENSLSLKNYDNDPEIFQLIDNNSQISDDVTTTKEIPSSLNHIKNVLKRPHQNINGKYSLEKTKFISDHTEVDVRVIKYIMAKRRSQNENTRKQHLLSLIPKINEMNATQYRKFCSQINVLIDGLLNTKHDTINTF